MRLTRFHERRYHGTVTEIRRDGVVVQWDDGEATEVYASQLMPETTTSDDPFACDRLLRYSAKGSSEDEA
jgi:hypothetical protein